MLLSRARLAASLADSTPARRRNPIPFPRAAAEQCTAAAAATSPTAAVAGARARQPPAAGPSTSMESSQLIPGTYWPVVGAAVPTQQMQAPAGSKKRARAAAQACGAAAAPTFRGVSEHRNGTRYEAHVWCDRKQVRGEGLGGGGGGGGGRGRGKGGEEGREGRRGGKRKGEGEERKRRKKFAVSSAGISGRHFPSGGGGAGIRPGQCAHPRRVGPHQPAALPLCCRVAGRGQGGCCVLHCRLGACAVRCTAPSLPAN